VRTGTTRCDHESFTYSDANVPSGFHVDQPLPVFTPPARYW
jgi:hypothetical protein